MIHCELSEDNRLVSSTTLMIHHVLYTRVTCLHLSKKLKMDTKFNDVV